MPHMVLTYALLQNLIQALNRKIQWITNHCQQVWMFCGIVKKNIGSSPGTAFDSKFDITQCQLRKSERKKFSPQPNGWQFMTIKANTNTTEQFSPLTIRLLLWNLGCYLELVVRVNNYRLVDESGIFVLFPRLQFVHHEWKIHCILPLASGYSKPNRRRKGNRNLWNEPLEHVNRCSFSHSYYCVI